MSFHRLYNMVFYLVLGSVALTFGNSCSHVHLTTAAISSTGTMVFPAGGPIAGGNQLTLSGTFSDEQLTIQVGGQNCPISSFSSTTVTCTVPAASAQWASIVVTQPDQDPTTLSQMYAYGASVVGQPNFITSSLNIGNTLSQPAYVLPIVTTSTQLFISDSQAGRVTIYPTAPTQSSVAPSAVLGKISLSGGNIPFTSSSAYALTMSAPKTMCTDGIRVMVVDSALNRVLIYGAIPTGPTSAPAFVLGQADFIGQQANRGSQTIDGTMLNNPQGIYCDATNIIVADTGNNRVLLWKNPITANGQSADVVLGQTDFTGETANQGGPVSASTLRTPRAVLFDATNLDLYVTDSGNQRVLIWTSLPTVNTQPANLALGPGSLTSGSGGGCVQGGFTEPAGLALVSGYLYVSDSSLNRIQSWSTSGGVITWVNGQMSSFVFGQTGFVACAVNQGGAATLSTLRAPTGLSSSGANLYVADTGNNRVLIYNTAPVTNTPTPPPDLFLGQSSVSGVNPAYSMITSSALRSPQSAAILDGALYVADPDLNRVLMFSPTPTASGSSASFVLGQPDMATAIPNLATGIVSALTLSSPKNIFMDSGLNLYVSDAENNRLLIYTSIPSANDPSAATVGGQSLMTTSASAVTAAGLHGATGVCEANGQLFVADPGNNRVLVFSAWSVGGGSGQSASFVIGQTNLTSNAANGGGTASATTLSNPAWLACNATSLVVSDVGNQRVLVYSLPIAANTPTAALVLGQHDFLSTEANQGTTAPSATSIYSPHGIALDGTQLYVADGHNNRILIWRNFPTVNGQAADAVFGQSTMTSYLPNSGSAAIGLTSLFGPAGLSVSGGLLVISDANNARVLIVPEP